jgi:hypothetical protein
MGIMLNILLFRGNWRSADGRRYTLAETVECISWLSGTQ